jgi:hypothetical protein
MAVSNLASRTENVSKMNVTINCKGFHIMVEVGKLESGGAKS